MVILFLRFTDLCLCVNGVVIGREGETREVDSPCSGSLPSGLQQLGLVQRKAGSQNPTGEAGAHVLGGVTVDYLGCKWECWCGMFL